eukprot:Gregarina_sp_Poly_1__4162@NODE_2278_length_2368_cov_45_005215_g1458_i0_p1_GENE_NODE_2278_length_2368_cov_45_005215_g1458_i0NODE_2278_length_2368_cov_45_005215_g1458_i0_p1_ORF_typecomplete_len730_score97_16_NODE_2278_length_2368_cov_45_005215_g1458_i01682357
MDEASLQLRGFQEKLLATNSPHFHFFGNSTFAIRHGGRDPHRRLQSVLKHLAKHAEIETHVIEYALGLYLDEMNPFATAQSENRLIEMCIYFPYKLRGHCLWGYGSLSKHRDDERLSPDTPSFLLGDPYVVQFPLTPAERRRRINSLFIRLLLFGKFGFREEDRPRVESNGDRSVDPSTKGSEWVELADFSPAELFPPIPSAVMNWQDEHFHSDHQRTAHIDVDHVKVLFWIYRVSNVSVDALRTISNTLKDFQLLELHRILKLKSQEVARGVDDRVLYSLAHQVLIDHPFPSVYQTPDTLVVLCFDAMIDKLGWVPVTELELTTAKESYDDDEELYPNPLRSRKRTQQKETAAEMERASIPVPQIVGAKDARRCDSKRRQQETRDVESVACPKGMDSENLLHKERKHKRKEEPTLKLTERGSSAEFHKHKHKRSRRRQEASSSTPSVSSESVHRRRHRSSRRDPRNDSSASSTSRLSEANSCDQSPYNRQHSRDKDRLKERRRHSQDKSHRSQHYEQKMAEIQEEERVMALDLLKKLQRHKKCADQEESYMERKRVPRDKRSKHLYSHQEASRASRKHRRSIKVALISGESDDDSLSIPTSSEETLDRHSASKRLRNRQKRSHHKYSANVSLSNDDYGKELKHFLSRYVTPELNASQISTIVRRLRREDYQIYDLLVDAKDDIKSYMEDLGIQRAPIQRILRAINVYRKHMNKSQCTTFLKAEPSAFH